MSILTSFALLFLCSILLKEICERLSLPPLMGYLMIGIGMGPYLLNLICPQILDWSPDIRQFALVVILTRAGLGLDLSALKKNGRSAIMLCFVPACFEILAYCLFGRILGLDLVNSALLGAVIAAVSPAVVVPRMLKLSNEGYGVKKGIPQMIMAGSSVDDVFVITMFTAFLSMCQGGGFSWSVLWKVPTSIVSGIAIGILVGMIINKFISRFDLTNLLLLVSVSFAFVWLEKLEIFPYSGLLSIMTMMAVYAHKNKEVGKEFSNAYNNLWFVAEMLLFILVGSAVDLEYAKASFFSALLVLVLGLIFRMVGTLVCVLGTKLNMKERLFCMISYCPKATVQAGIGAVALGAGLASGSIILTVAVLSIILTAPIGAFVIDHVYKKLLTRDVDYVEPELEFEAVPVVNKELQYDEI